MSNTIRKLFSVCSKRVQRLLKSDVQSISKTGLPNFVLLFAVDNGCVRQIVLKYFQSFDLKTNLGQLT